MAGSKHLIAQIEVDRDGGVDVEGLTLEALSANIARAIGCGVDRKSRVQFGYVPERLAEGLFVVEPIDLTKASFDELRVRTRTNDNDISTPAWAEIKRRVEAFGQPGDHDV